MYSRFPPKPEPPVRLPEHYSGCAFSAQGHRRSQEPPEPPPIPVHFDEEKEAHKPFCAACDEHSVPTASNVTPAEVHTGASLFGGKSAILPNGLGFEEMLLLGLILLLSQDPQHSDIMIWLALLLFCK